MRRDKNKMDIVGLKLDDQNELEFKLEIEASEQISLPRARLMCEGQGLSYVFDGEVTKKGDIKVIIPSMKNHIKEGTYVAKLEVFVDNKYFVPLEFQAEFKDGVKIVAEIKTKSTDIVKASIVPKLKTSTLKEDKQRRLKILLAKKKKLEENKRKRAKLQEAKKQKQLEEDRRKKLLKGREKKRKAPDKELQELLDDLGIGE